MLNVVGISVPLYLTVNDEDNDKAGIGTSKVDNVKNLRYGCNTVELSIVKSKVMLLTDDLLRAIGILISYPTDELCISYTVTVSFCPETTFTIND